MDCQTIREKTGSYLDGELSSQQSAEFEQHTAACPTCASEVDRMRKLIVQLSQSDDMQDVKAPSQLWQAIEQQLNQAQPSPVRTRGIRAFRRPLAAAASLAILIGAGVFLGIWLSVGTGTAQAVNIDYSLLLDGLAEDVDAAVLRFFDHYNAVPIEADQAQAAGPQLSFAIPPQLPGGFRIEQAYRLKFGDTPGIAARYRRDQEPLVVFFHPPVKHTEFGIHRESQCHVAGREGQQVETGPWRLIHFTDPTTCHCLLSKLDTEAELLAVLSAVSPTFTHSNNINN